MFFWQQTSFNIVDIIAIFQKQNNSCLKILIPLIFPVTFESNFEF